MACFTLGAASSLDRFSVSYLDEIGVHFPLPSKSQIQDGQESQHTFGALLDSWNLSFDLFPMEYRRLPFHYHVSQDPWNIGWLIEALIVGTRKKYGWERPVCIRAATVRLAIVSHPNDIVTIFKSRSLSARSITERASKFLLTVPESVMPFYRADDSGMAAEPRKGSTVEPHNRILYLQTHNAQKWMASPHLEPVTKRFGTILQRRFQALQISEDWVEYPSFFIFLEQVIHANIEAVMGSKILKLNPSLVQDFCDAKQHAPGFFRGWPRWLMPKAFRARDRIIDGVQRWHEYALGNGDHQNTGDGEPDWDPIWGSQYSKVRRQRRHACGAEEPRS